MHCNGLASVQGHPSPIRNDSTNRPVFRKSELLMAGGEMKLLFRKAGDLPATGLPLYP